MNNVSSRGNVRIIRASEIGQYAYCAHAWWLSSIEGLPSSHHQELAAGEASHLRHGKGVRLSRALARLAYVTLALAIILGIVWMLSWTGGQWR